MPSSRIMPYQTIVLPIVAIYIHLNSYAEASTPDEVPVSPAAKSAVLNANDPLMSYTEPSDMLPIRCRLETREPLVLAAPIDSVFFVTARLLVSLEVSSSSMPCPLIARRAFRIASIVFVWTLPNIKSRATQLKVGEEANRVISVAATTVVMKKRLTMKNSIFLIMSFALAFSERMFRRQMYNANVRATSIVTLETALIHAGIKADLACKRSPPKYSAVLYNAAPKCTIMKIV